MQVKKNSKRIEELEAQVARLRASVERQSHMSKGSMYYCMRETAVDLSKATGELLEEYRKCL